jgi:hypothetical protein
MKLVVQLNFYFIVLFSNDPINSSIMKKKEEKCRVESADKKKCLKQLTQPLLLCKWKNYDAVKFLLA